MSTVNITMDASSVVAAANAMTNAIGATTATVRQAALETARYDRAGNLISGTMRGVDSAGRQFVATVTNIGGVLTVTNTKFVDLNKSATVTKQKINDITKAMNDLAGMFQRFAGYRALGGITDGLNEGFDAARKFQVEISLIRTLSQDNQLSFGTWARGIKNVSDELGFSLADTTKAAYDTISNQIAKGAAVFPFLREAGELARVNMGATLEQATNLLSSAINAYGFSISRTRELSALFFATIDEGRVTMNQMSDTFGRVAILAKGLNIPIHELNASIAFLTQKGVTTDDAFTFMRNVFVQLQKPSEALAAFFRRIGVESGQAAIATYGFMGILRKIKEEVGAGNADVAGLFPEIRAQQPIQAALNDFAGFEAIAQRFGNTAQLINRYQNAIDIRGESPADYLDKEFNKLKNTFTADLGQQILNLTKEIVDGLRGISKFFTGKDSLSAGVNLLLISIRDLVVMIVTYRTTVSLTTAVTAAWSVATGAAGVAATKTAAEVAAANVTMRATVIGLVASLAALAATKFFFSNDILAGPGRLEGMAEEIKKIREEIIRTNATPLVDPFQAINDATQFQFRSTLQGLATLASRSDAQLDRIRTSNRRQREESQNAFQTYTDALKNNLKNLEKSVTDSENIIERGRRNLESFRDSLNKMVNDTRLQYLVGEQKIRFLREQEETLLSRAQAGIRSNVPERIAEAERQLREAAEARRERFRAEQDLFRTQNPGLTDEQYRNRALEETRRLESDLNGIYALAVSLQQGLTRERENQIRLTRDQIALERRRLRDVEDQFKRFNEFSAFDGGGNIAARYRQQGSNRIDTGAAIRDFDAAADAVRAAVSQTGDVAARIQVEAVIAERRRRMILELSALERSEAIRVTQQRVQGVQTEYQAAVEAQRTAVANAAIAQRTALEQAGNLGPDLMGAARQARSTQLLFSVGGIEVVRTGRREFQATEDAVARLNTALSTYDATLRRAREDQQTVNGQQVAKPENILALQRASREVQAANRALYTPFAREAGGSVDDLIIPGTNPPMTVREFELALQRREQAWLAHQARIQTMPGNLADLQGRFSGVVQPQLDQLNRLDPGAFPRTAAELATSTNNAVTATNNLTTAIETLTRTIQNVGLPPPAVNLTPGRPPALNSPPTPRALGGWMGGGPTGVIGPDTMYHVGRGEFMVNAESAAMFPDTLQAINSARRGSIPQVLGGNVSHQRIGDIYITVNEAKDGQDTSRQVWSRIRREIRRGNIT